MKTKIEHTTLSNLNLNGFAGDDRRGKNLGQEVMLRNLQTMKFWANQCFLCLVVRTFLPFLFVLVLAFKCVL